MTLQQLHQVITIAESRSMNEASRKLFVSQPNLSAVVRELEEEAGITIFIRSDFIKYTKQYFYMDMGTKPNYNGKRIS